MIDPSELPELAERKTLAASGRAEHEGHGENDAVRHWLTARLADAPPLTTEQLQRLRLLLGVEQLTGMKSA